MTENKPIMIDGVDVSGCKKLDREYAPNYPEIGGYDWFNECKETSTDCQGRNCLFKQLARKSQECEELKKIIDEAKSSKLDLKSFLVGEAVHNEYEQQLNKLRKERNKFKKQYRKNRLDRKKLEQKLERIREVLTNITEAGLCEAKECGCDDNKECLECTLNEIKDVIQIIDEVK